MTNTRVGIGFDAHSLGAGQFLILGGVQIPHSKGLVGHSDSDVLTHAVIDALLGAAALGDLGSHFPSSNPIYKDISSLVLLRKTIDILHQKGWHTSNVDATITAQTPKLGPFILSMREQAARALSLPPGRISVKATTTDHLGFVGREEGIAAYAVASIVSDQATAPD